MSELKQYLLLAGIVGASYLAYNHFKQNTIPLQLTRKIAQQIKHQMMIVTINFADGISKHAAGPAGVKVNEDKVNEYFVEELGKIYKQKEDLILAKYAVTEDAYRNSLARYGKDKKLAATTDEILDMMSRAVKGIVPDLTVPQEASYSFSKEDIRSIYKDMCILIAQKVSAKLLEEKQKNPYFDPNDDSVFRKAIRQLSIYDVKVEFLKGRGFKESWGCPNEMFFKISESLKLRDAGYKAQMVKIEKNYENVIDKVSKDPESVRPEEVEGYFVERVAEPQAVLSRSLNPVRGAQVLAQLSRTANVESLKKSQEVEEELLRADNSRKQSEEVLEQPQRAEPENLPEVGKEEVHQGRQEEASEAIPHEPVPEEPIQHQPLQEQAPEGEIIQHDSAQDESMEVELPADQAPLSEPAPEAIEEKPEAEQEQAVDEVAEGEPADQQPVEALPNEQNVEQNLE